jgi:hypothetical protein
MCPDMFRRLAVECLQLAQKAGDPERRSLLIDMAHSWADLANSAGRFERLVETAPVNRSPERSAVSPIKAAGWRLPYSRHSPRSALIIRSMERGRAKRKVNCLTPRRQHDGLIALPRD